MTRQFQTPKTRVFQAPVEEFHANHDQADHGNRAGGRKRPPQMKEGAWKAPGSQTDDDAASDEPERPKTLSERAEEYKKNRKR